MALVVASSFLLGCEDAPDGSDGHDEGGAAGSGGAPFTSGGSAGGNVGGADFGSGGLSTTGGEGGSTTPERPRLTPADLATRSAASYEDNESGLIHPETLSRWLADWTNERPDVIDRDLVVLQLGIGEIALPYVRTDDQIRTYLVNGFTGLSEVRLTGVTAIGRSPARGVQVDVALRRFRIDPERDFVLLVSGAGEAGDLETLARAWLTLRYWGFSHENLGILHGNVAADLADDERSASVLVPPIDGTRRVPSLDRDQFSLLASVGDVRDVVAEERALLDVRSAAAFEGTALSTSVTDATCLAGAPSCTALFGGKIPGARHLAIEEILEGDASRLLDLDAIDLALASVDLDSETDVIVYDDEGDSSALAAFTLLAVAGIPARWYAGSFVEWGSLNASHPESALRTLPTDSPWRSENSGEITLWAGLEHGIRPLIFDPYAAASDALLTADRAYLDAPPLLPGPGDGGSGCAD